MKIYLIQLDIQANNKKILFSKPPTKIGNIKKMLLFLEIIFFLYFWHVFTTKMCQPGIFKDFFFPQIISLMKSLHLLVEKHKYNTIKLINENEYRF